MFYFVFRDHFASAFVGVAGLVIGVVGLVVGVIPLFQREPLPTEDRPAEPPEKKIIMPVNTG
jgi:hypothetical protein